MFTNLFAFYQNHRYFQTNLYKLTNTLSQSPRINEELSFFVKTTYVHTLQLKLTFFKKYFGLLVSCAILTALL